ncbi:MAG: methyltransferase domain-containing protein [Betaproteobacteria bacterium]|nr:methyltransferase domain-containing protein [Betaproteobacteria bacterium]
MTLNARAARLLLAFAFALCGLPAYAQKFEPQVGQAGKDVIWVPTPDEVVERMLTMAQLQPGEIHFDLGAGDGKIAIAAAKKGARATGIEYNPDMVKYANAKAQEAGVAGVGPGKAVIRQADIFATDFSSANVITLYLLPTLNMRLRPQILAMKPGTRIVSHSFSMEDWDADEISVVDGRRVYFWMVPATVQGAWTLDLGSAKTELAFEQHFQKINGTVAVGNVQAGLREPYLRGPQIAFAYVDNGGVRREFTGTVNGRQMSGDFRDDKGNAGKWSAAKR